MKTRSASVHAHHPEILEARIAPAVAISPLAQLPAGVEAGHAVDFYKANDQVLNLASALDLITNKSRQLFTGNDDGVAVINYTDPVTDPSPAGTIGGDRDIRIPVPQFGVGGADFYVVRSHGFLFIPAAGTWTFSVNSDDGFRLRVGTEGAVVTEFDDLRGPETSSGEATVAEPGYYPYELVAFENGSGSEVEFFATGPGQTEPTLVGDPAGQLEVFHAENLIAPLPGRLAGGALGHEVTFYKAIPGFAIEGLDDARVLISQPDTQSFTLTDNGVATINYVDDESAAGGDFAGDRDLNAIPTSQFAADGDDDDYALRARGFLYIPQAGDWRFAVNSNNGFRLSVGGWETGSHSEGVVGDVNGVLSVLAPGFYQYELLAFESSGGSGFEFSARGPGQGANVLVGDVARGGLAVFQTVTPATANPGTVNLGTLTGGDGFRVSGILETDFAYAGRSVSDAGDINGDGFGDFIVGVPRSDTGGTNHGAAYVVFGKAGGFPAGLTGAQLDGTNGFQLSGVADYDDAGRSVSGAGDVNGDGFADILVSAPYADEGGPGRGAAYVVFGKAGGFGASLDPGSLDGTNGFKLTGVADGDLAGYSVSGAGDVNGDGFADILIGAPFADEGGNNRGAAYVVFGKAGGFGASLDPGSLDGTNGFKLTGVADGDLAGNSVSGAGDVNGDGFADILIGTRYANEGGNSRGAAYVVFGKAGGFGASLALGDLNGSNGFKLTGVADGDRAGNSVSGAGDVNGDGFADILIGARLADEGGTNRGAAYVVFGKAGGFGASLALGALNGTDGFKLTGVSNEERAGSSVSSAGDVNGDGFDDILVGIYEAHEGGTDRGAAFLLFGKAGGFDASVPAGTPNGTDAIRFSGVADDDEAGREVSGAGDVNGDGFADILISSIRADEGGERRGAVYVIFGKPTERAMTVATTPNLAPFAIAPNGKSAAFTDVDGDLVTVKITKGTLAPGNFILHAAGQGARLALLDLSDAEFAKTNVTLSAKPQKLGGILRGDARADVATLDATGTPLGKVLIPGVLGSITAGDGFTGIAALTTGGIGAAPDAAGQPRLAESAVFGSVKALTVKGDLTAAHFLAGAFGKVSIAGSIRAGGVDGAGLASASTIGSIAVKGGITGDSQHRVDITADGIANPTAKTAIALKSLAVTGAVEFARIAVGGKANADAQIGTVTVGGIFRTSDIAAGAAPGTADRLGDANDAIIGDGGNTILSRIAAITLKGGITGTSASGDNYGLVAEQIGKLTIGKTILTPTNNLSLAITGDVRVRLLT